MTRVLTLMICAAVILFTGLSAAADTIVFDNGTPEDFYPAAQPVIFPPVMIAEEFTLANGQNVVTGIEWWGTYSGPEPTLDIFNITFLAQIPGGTFGGYTPFITLDQVHATRTPTGLLSETEDPVYRFNYEFAPLPLIPDMPCLLSIASSGPLVALDGPVLTAGWAWSYSSLDGNHGTLPMLFGPEQGSEWVPAGGELAFNLTGPGVVPEPASISLLGLGLGALVMRRLRKRA